MEKVIVITGATATGKTDISIRLASLINGEIISADSMMVYKYMDIGTAKPSLEDRRKIPHYVIDVVYPNENFSVQDFINISTEKIKEIQNKGKIPIVVGGTWLYIQSLLYGLSKAPPSNKDLREKLYKEDNKTLFEKLLKVDPDYSKKIHINDKKRIVRALEVYYLTGKPFSSFHNWNKPLYDFAGFVFSYEKELLFKRIEKRVEKMFSQGLVKEVELLIDMGFKDSLTAPQAIGYKEVIPYVEGKISFDECKSQIIKNTKNFAKIQIRTFKNKFVDKNWYHLDITNYEIEQILDKILEKINKKEE